MLCVGVCSWMALMFDQSTGILQERALGKVNWWNSILDQDVDGRMEYDT